GRAGGVPQTGPRPADRPTECNPTARRIEPALYLRDDAGLAIEPGAGARPRPGGRRAVAPGRAHRLEQVLGGRPRIGRPHRTAAGPGEGGQEVTTGPGCRAHW